jgi:hypothetical protein
MRIAFLGMALAIAPAFWIQAARGTADAPAERAAFREFYEEMVEIESSPSAGSCTGSSK